MNATPPGLSSIDCQPLLDAARARLYLDNPFRITGLSVLASAKDISRHADKMKMLEELGQGADSRTAAFALTPVPSSDQIREAIVRLKDPERRIVDEFFWFWPESDDGRSEDAALQALSTGDQNAAHRLWCDRTQNPSTRFVAIHNLAVLYHLVALDWTHYHLAEAVDARREDKIKWYWVESLKHWGAVASDDRVWDRVRSRVRAIDDARLTSGFVRRMENSLPRALNIVTAEVAVKFAQNGNLEWARTHLCSIGARRDELIKTAEIVLEPVRTRLRHQIDATQSATDKNPKAGATAVRQLLDLIEPQRPLFELFDERNASPKDDLFDDAALTCLRCAGSYLNATNDEQTYVQLLQESHRLAVTDDARQRVELQLQNAEANLQRKALEPVIKKLDSIQAPKDKLQLAQKELMPRLAAVIQKHGSGSRQAQSLSDAVAEIFRTISLDACNNHDDLQTAQAASTLALKLSQSPALKARLIEDQTALQKIVNEADRHNLLLKIRRDEIEVNQSFFRYNRRKIAADNIGGVRHGILRQYVNGVPSGASFLLEVKSRQQDPIRIECSRLFRSQQQSQSDYDAILTALGYHIFSPLAVRIAKDILSGNDWRLGSSVFRSAGVVITTGFLCWKKEHLVPYDKLQSQYFPGAIRILSKDNPRIHDTYSLRKVWNAAIIERVVIMITQLQNPSR